MDEVSVPTWPESPNSRTLPTYVDWQRAHPDCAKTITPGIANLLPQNAIEAIVNRHTYLLEQFPPEVRAIIMARKEGRSTSTTVLTPVRFTSITKRMEEIEDIRARIPVEQCLAMLLTGASTGEMDGCILQAKERIDILKYLVNRVIPEAKSIDTIERGFNLDRVRRSAKEMTKGELSKLSKQELLDLMEDDEPT